MPVYSTTDDEIQRDPATGLVTDGRERHARNCVARAVNLEPDGGPERWAEIAWAEFKLTTDLSRPGRFNSEAAWQRDIEAKARAIDKKVAAGGFTPSGRLVEVPHRFDLDEVPLIHAEERLGAAVMNWFAEVVTWPSARTNREGSRPVYKIKPRRRVIASTAGTGKSEEVLRALVRMQHWDDVNARIASALSERDAVKIGGNPHAKPDDFPNKQGQLVVWMMTASGDLAKELATRFAALGGRGQVIRGRTQGYNHQSGMGADQSPCKRPAAVYEVAQRGIPNISATLCHRAYKDEHGEKQHIDCPLRDQCDYFSQFSADSGVFFMASDYLFTQISADRVPHPDLVIIDESITTKLADVKRPIPTEEVAKSAGIYGPLAMRIMDALERDETPVLDPAELKAAIAALEPPDFDARPDMDEKDIIAAARDWQPPAALRLFRWARDWYPEGEVRDAEISWSKEKDGNRRRRLLMQRRKEFVPALDDTPWLLLDATANEFLCRELWDAEFARIDARRNATMIQVHGKTAAKDEINAKTTAGENLRQSIAWIAERMPCERGLLVTHDKAEELIGGLLPPNWQTAHFNALRGRDTMKDCDAVIVAGRPLPDEAAVRRMAKGLFWDAPEIPLYTETMWMGVAPGEPRITPTTYELLPEGFVMRSGEDIGVVTRQFEGAVCEYLRQAICTAEIEQAADRIRSVRAELPKAIMLISEIPTRIPVDVLVGWQELRDGLRVEVAAKRMGGFLPSDTAWLAAKFPDLWTTAKAAKNDLQRYKAPENLNGPNSYINIYRDMGHLIEAPVWRFRIAGQRGRLQWLRTFHDEAAIREWLTANFGEVVELARPET